MLAPIPTLRSGRGLSGTRPILNVRNLFGAQREREREDREFNERRRIGPPGVDVVVTMTDDDIVHAGKYPT